MDRERFSFLLLDRLEYQARAGKDGWGLGWQRWIGGDYNKLWLKSEGEAKSRVRLRYEIRREFAPYIAVRRSDRAACLVLRS